ncbi:MAG: D-TA family PLP-dependent enzyme, partial [Nannocystaceae bacterium]
QCGPGVPSLPDDLSFRGLHGYDGHHRSHERSAAHTSYDSLVQLARTLELQPAHTVITSGTHSYEHALVHGGLSEGPWQQEVSPGTIVLSDLRSAHAADALSLRQAVFVASRVVSVGEGRVTLDAGSKALNPDVRPPHCALLGWPELEVGSPSEEHLPVWGPTDAMPALGELVWIVPAHACTTVNLYQEALYVRDGTYAGAGTIDAAGHPLWIEGHRE